MADIPHIAYPLRLAGGRLAVDEQDSLADVRSSVHVLLRTPRGARPLAPEVGLEDPTFTAGVDTGEITALLGEHEPRADVTVTTGAVDPMGRQAVTVDVRLNDEGGDL